MKEKLKDNIIKLKQKNDEKKQLENTEIIKEYLKITKNKEVKKYLEIINNINNLDSTIKEIRRLIEEQKQYTCPHNNLLFLSDETTPYDIKNNREYYRCMCLDCELIARFLFKNGKRENTKLLTTNNITEYIEYNIKIRKRTK